MSASPVPGFGEALRFWFKLGCIGFGGPAGQIAIMHAELVERRRWISERRFLHALNYCMVLPGPEAQQLATYLGWLLHRTRGGIAAGMLFVLPSLLLLLALSWLYMTHGRHPLVAGAFYGIKPAVTAIVLHAAWRIGSRVLKAPPLWGLALAAFVAVAVLKLPFPAIVAGAALAGWLGGRLWPGSFAAAGPAPRGVVPTAATRAAASAATRAATNAATNAATYAAASAAAPGDMPGSTARAPALIDDDTPPPPHAGWRPWRLAAVVAAGLLLWALPLALLAAWHGGAGTLVDMAWFFTKAALLTFGGAYAVLPYVWQGAVVQFGWLSPAQMIDGLALGETTPGPLIMVVAFVAFVGGWGAADLTALLGPGSAASAGVLAALVVTWFTFLPSFVFILAGAPLVEATRGNVRLGAPLAAITAAVVGVIANLALLLGSHVLWPRGTAASFDAVAALLMAAAALALFVARRGVVEVVAAAGLTGALLAAFAPRLVTGGP